MITIPVRERSQIAEARRQARDLAEDLRLAEIQVARAALVATESATNLERHAGSGEILLIPHPHPSRPALDLVAIDHGPGMENPSTCMKDGYSTKGGSGHGLGTIQRQSDRFDVFSTPGKGTVIVATIGSPPAPEFGFQVEGICSPKPGETQCGDGWSYLSRPDATTLMICDGLGHGPAAAMAAREAVRLFEIGGRAELDTLIVEMDAGLGQTRGAAIALARLPAEGARVSFLGVGNISGCLRSGAGVQRTVSFEGVVGRGSFRPRPMAYEIEDPFLAIFATDGLSTRWDLAKYRGLMSREPITIAAVLYRDHRRMRDDCTVIVARRSRS